MACNRRTLRTDVLNSWVASATPRTYSIKFGFSKEADYDLREPTVEKAACLVDGVVASPASEGTAFFFELSNS